LFTESKKQVLTYLMHVAGHVAGPVDKRNGNYRGTAQRTFP